MHIVKKTGYVILAQKFSVPSRITHESHNWKIWRANVTLTTCHYCASMNGHILSVNDPALDKIPVHPNCRCFAEWVEAILAGTATSSGVNGVDLYVATYGVLPSNYLTKKKAKKLGWNPLAGNLADVLPGMLIGGDPYKNRDGRLPYAPGRIWYEADFDYTGGFRNDCRLIFSKDGLLFVTYDHYETFIEIVLEEVK